MMANMMKLIAASALVASSVDAYTPPNIVFFLADDIGWSDFGYFGYDMAGGTPTIDTLASEGVKLYAVYGGTSCSPGRASFLSGRYPMRFGMQGGAIGTQQKKGIFVNESLISNEMKSVGYHTLAVGKWHVGHSSWSQTPTFRGFDYFYGFMCNGQMDPLTKMNGNYLDLYNDGERVTDETSLSEDTRSSWLFEAKAEDFIANNRANYGDEPFFIYYALQDPHTPLSSPEYFLESEPCADMSDSSRKTYCGMMRCIDASVEGLMAALSAYGYYANTLIFFAGDNGGAPKNGGYNWPLRGSKGTLFEGGIRQASFVWGTMLSDNVRGTVYDGAIHLVDMMPTLMGLATGGHWVPPETKSLDGMDVWSAISTGGTSPRNVTLLNCVDSSGGLRMGDWSLLVNQKDDGWYNPMASSATSVGYIESPEAERKKMAVSTTSGDDYYWLYDVSTDPYQYNDLAESYPEVVEEMMALLNVYIAQQVDSSYNSDKEDAANTQAASTGYWGPWVSESKDQAAQQSAQTNKGNLVTEY